ncbi:hypothetical protein ACOMHN_055688 [Nucella lapillus]
MAESLRRLVNTGSFTVLQGKLERWSKDYYTNTCDQNSARCCEIIELNAKVQGQLFHLLSLCAQEGGLYGGTNIIKSRLLPWLGQSFFTSGGAVTADTSLSVLAEAAAKERELGELQDLYEKSLSGLEEELQNTQAENRDLKDELQDTKIELDRSLQSSTSDQMFTEFEVKELKRKLTELEEENKALRAKAGLLNDYQTEVRRLREDIALLTARRDRLQSSTPQASPRLPSKSSKPSDLQASSPQPSPRLSSKSCRPRDLERMQGLAEAQNEITHLRRKSGLAENHDRRVQTIRDELHLGSISRPRLPAPTLPNKVSDDFITSYRYKPGPLTSPLSIDDPVQRIRQQNALARFNDLFSQDRLDAMDTLRRYSDDHENNQRILFAALCESFNAAKTAYRQFKMKTRAGLAKMHCGPDTLEEAVQDYINRNTDLLDTASLVSDVIRALNRNSKVFLPPDTSFAIIQPFIREAVKLAWQMTTLAHPLDIATAADAELFDDSKYRRSYDSEYNAPLVSHHVWPALMQGKRVVVKGEANTRRGASLSTPKRSRSPTRSHSPTFASQPRSLSPSRYARSRSPSQLRRSASPRRLL